MVLDSEYWVTREGQELKPSQLGDEHLVNAIRYLLDNANDIAMCYRSMPSYPCFSGDGADYYAGHTFEAEYNKSNLQWMKEQRIYKLLVAEAKKRGLEKLALN